MLCTKIKYGAHYVIRYSWENLKYINENKISNKMLEIVFDFQTKGEKWN